MKIVNKNEKKLIVGYDKPVIPKHTINSSVRSETIDYKKQGKRNKRMGADFERRTRTDLESKGWVVSKWINNVEFVDHYEDEGFKIPFRNKFGKCVPAKPSRFQLHGTGFPDFIAYKLKMQDEGDITEIENFYDIHFVESKVNGILSKIEKEKAQWYLKNNYCSKFIIAYKTKEKNKVKVNYKGIEENE